MQLPKDMPVVETVIWFGSQFVVCEANHGLAGPRRAVNGRKKKSYDMRALDFIA